LRCGDFGVGTIFNHRGQLTIWHYMQIIINNIKRLTNKLRQSRIAKNSFYQLSGTIAQSILLVITMPLLIHTMGAEQYGLWMVASSLLGIVGTLEMGLGSGVIKFVAEYVAKEDYKGLSSTILGTLVLYLTIGILLSFPLYYFAPNIIFLLKLSQNLSSIGEKSIRVITFGFLPLLLLNIGLAVPMGLQRYGISNLISFSRVALTQLVAIVIVFSGGHVYHVLIGNVVVLWLCSLFSLLIGLKILVPYRLSFFFSWQYGKKLLSFSKYVILQNLGSQIFSSVDRLAVGRVLGIDAVTYYSVGTMIASRFFQLMTTISHSFMPHASEAFASKDYQKIFNLFSRGTYITALFSLSFGFVIILFSKPLLQIWMGVDFSNHSLLMARVLLLIYAVFSINAPAFFIANGMGVPWISSFASILGGSLTIGLILLLGNIWGLAGVAWANCGYFLTFMITVYVARRLKYALAQEVI